MDPDDYGYDDGYDYESDEYCSADGYDFDYDFGDPDDYCFYWSMDYDGENLADCENEGEDEDREGGVRIELGLAELGLAERGLTDLSDGELGDEKHRNLPSLDRYLAANEGFSSQESAPDGGTSSRARREGTRESPYTDSEENDDSYYSYPSRRQQAPLPPAECLSDLQTRTAAGHLETPSSGRGSPAQAINYGLHSSAPGTVDPNPLPPAPPPPAPAPPPAPIRRSSSDPCCIVCFTTEPNIVLIPCGHLILCKVGSPLGPVSQH